jgi:hypothetical protein
VKLKPILVAVTAMSAVGSLAACSSGTVATTADTTSATPTSAAGAAGVGDSITIAGNADGSQVQVTVKTVKRTRSKDRFMKVGKKHKLIAVQFEIVNTGTVPYDDAPSNGAVVVDSKGQQFEPTIMFSKIRAGALLPASVKITPGSKALGYLVFEVPKASTITQVQFSMDSGFGETAQWQVS